MDTNQLYIENIGIGLASIEKLQNLDLKNNEYLVVGERANFASTSKDIEYNLIVNNQGVGINATRREMEETNAGLFINNNIICKGKIIANHIEFDNFTLDSSITSEKLITLINSVNCNLLFYEGHSNIYNKVIYTPSYLTLGNYNSTFSNFHPLKISDSPNGKLNNIQIAIYNNANNSIEPSKIGFGLLGFNSKSPAIFTTTTDMPLEFHISKTSSNINKLYENNLGLPEYNNSNYPQLAIDINGCVNINKNYCDISFEYNNKINNPKLFVNGLLYASNIFMYDNQTNSNLNITDIFVTKTGVLLTANQIKGGDFVNQEFTFNSNVNIGKTNDNYLLTINDSLNVKNRITTNILNTNNIIVNGSSEFNRPVTFNNNVIFTNDFSIAKSLNIGNDLFISGNRVNFENAEFATNGFNFDVGSNLSIGGRLGIGISPIDSYDHQFNIIKRNSERFEIYLDDMAGITNDSSKVFIGHSKLNNLNGNIDNSLIFLTQKNVRWHNIYFYPGKDKDGSYGLNYLTPTLAIMENNRIGINTNIPQKTLDVIGEITCSDYYIKKNNQNYKINYIIFDNTNNSILKVNKFDINLNDNQVYNNKQVLNITGGINSYDGYYQGDLKLQTFLIYPNFNISSINDNIGIGVIQTNNTNPLPLQIRNSKINTNNNTIIRLYRGVRGGGINNDALYTGIDFCDYDMPIPIYNRNNYKWFIYKNHRPENLSGVLQIGYTDNSINPTHSCMNFYYNDINKRYFIDINNPRIDYNYNPETSLSIKGNVDIQGNLNLIGENSTYKINGIIVGSFSNPAIMKVGNSTSPTTIYNDNLNDVSIIANNIGILPNKSIVYGFYKDDWIFQKINNLNSDVNNNTPVFIYNNRDYLNTIPPVITKFYNKSFKNYSARPDIASIELGILLDDTSEGTIKNKVNLSVKGYDDLTVFDISPNNKYPFITFINKDNKNQINIGNKTFYNNLEIIYPNSAININDDFEYLLNLTNPTNTVKIAMNNDDNNWVISANSNYEITYNNNNLININNNQIIINNHQYSSNNNSSFNINGNLNKSCVEFTNHYYNDYQTSVNSFETTGYIETYYSNLTFQFNNDFDSSKFIYTIHNSNLPTFDINNNPLINYSINTCNFIYNNSELINLNLNLTNIQSDFKFLDDIIVDSNNNVIKIVPNLLTFDPNITTSIISFNTINKTYDINGIDFNLSYILPKTKEPDDININSFLLSSNYYSNFDNNRYANISLRTILNVKDNYSIDYLTKIINNKFIVSINDIKHHFNTINEIYYYPNEDITFSDINVNINYNYIYNNEIIIPKNFFNNYNNQLNINIDNYSNINIYNSNNYLTDLIKGYPGINIDASIINRQINSNITYKNIPIQINNIYIANIPIKFTRYNYYELYEFNDISKKLPLPINVSKYQPHLILKNNINSKFSQPHKFYSYENNYEIHLDNNKLLTLDSNGNLNTSGSLNVKDIYFSGDVISTKEGFTSIYSNLSHSNFIIHKKEISLNSSNIFLNPTNNGGIIINRGNLYENNNLFEINNNIGNDNFIILKSKTNSSFIHYSGTNNHYRIGMNNGNFGIWNTKDINIINATYLDNNYTNFSNVISFNYNNNDIYPTINLDGKIISSSNLQINNITTYVNNELNYQMRVFGNIKIDGIVMSASDNRLKRNINKIENALDKISKLNGVTYTKIGNDKLKETGLIAQEVKEVIPEVVYEDENGYLNIAYGNLLGLVIEAIKELKVLIK